MGLHQLKWWKNTQTGLLSFTFRNVDWKTYALSKSLFWRVISISSLLFGLSVGVKCNKVREVPKGNGRVSALDFKKLEPFVVLYMATVEAARKWFKRWVRTGYSWCGFMAVREDCHWLQKIPGFFCWSEAWCCHWRNIFSGSKESDR